MRIFRWWLVRGDYGDVHDLPSWAYDEVIGSRWQSGLLELRVKKLTRRETELRQEIDELRHRLAVARGEAEEHPQLATEADAPGSEAPSPADDRQDHDLPEADALPEAERRDASPSALRRHWVRSPHANGHARDDVPVRDRAEDEVR